MPSVTEPRADEPAGGYCGTCGSCLDAEHRPDLRVSVIQRLAGLPKPLAIDEVETLLGAVADWAKIAAAKGQLDARDGDKLYDLAAHLQDEIGETT